MSTPQTWVEALNISEQNLQAWSSEAPEGQPLLVWCLEQGKVSTQDYLAWACHHYGLPVVSSNYFEQGLDREFIRAQRDTDTWSPWCYAVEQWDDISIVACVEPPRDPLPRTSYVLADPAAMRQAWGENATSPGELPDGLSLDIQKPFKLDLNSEEAPAPPSPKAELTTEEKLNQKTATFTLNFSDESAFDLPPVPVVDEAPTDTENLAPVAALTPPPLENAAVKRVSPSEANQNIVDTLERLERTFDAAYLMSASKDRLELHKWGPKTKPANQGKNAQVELVYPSLFRIVARTLMPYHGFVVDSPAHREMFEALGLPELPKCITAVPLKIDGELTGVLIVVGQESHQNMEYLKLVEHEAEALTAKLGSKWSQAA